MTTVNPTGFCPRCNQQVLLVRKEFDTCLAIVLLLFTFIGFFIYIAVYYSKKEDRCIHCGTQISYLQPQTQLQSTPTSDIPAVDVTPDLQPQTQVNYCPLCGEKLSDPTQKYCSNCGSKII